MTRTVTAAPLPVSVSGDLGDAACESVTGEVLNRPGLHGAYLMNAADRGILALFDSADGLVYYRDMVPGRRGYTVRLDMAADSGSVLDRSTGEVVRGPVAEFRGRPELGPPDTLAALVMARCGQTNAQ